MQFEAKLLIFVLYATNASYNPFFTLFMQDKGFTSLEVGVLISVTRIVMLVTTPVVCGIAEARKIHQQLMAGLACAAGSAMIAFYLGAKSRVIWALLVYSVCSSAKGAISDTLVLAACRRGNASYAMQRLWGSASWGVVSLLIGVALRELYASSPGGVKYTYVPLLHAASMFCLAFVLAFVFKVPGADDAKQEEGGGCAAGDGSDAAMTKKHTPPAAAAEGARSSLQSSRRPRQPRLRARRPHSLSQVPQKELYIAFVTHRSVLIPLIAVALLAMSESGLSNFIFPHLRAKHAAPPILFSWVLVLHSASEVVCFALGSWLLRNIGVTLLFIAASCSFAVKAHAYAILVDPWEILAVEWMHGLCFAFLWTAAVAHVDAAAKQILTVEALAAQRGVLKLSDKDNDDVDNVEDNEEGEEEEEEEGGRAAGGPVASAVRNRAATAEQSASTAVRQSAVAMTTLWFCYGGLPPILAGVCCGYLVQTVGEIVLFRVLSVLCVGIAAAFALMGQRRLLSFATSAPT